ncbi:MAG: hypothetical protein JO210_00900 [Acidobacteriaceae bacterium]|nr:hypothetical protein [Acidobacteriaceae bacterium]
MKSSFLRPGKTAIMTGAIAIIASLGFTPPARAQAPNGQQSAGQQPSGTPQKNYKDRGEYDLYSKITQTQDPKARLDLLNQWQDKYPQTEFSQERNEYFIATLAQLAPTDPSMRQKLLDKCNDVLKTDPKNFRANYLVAVWGPAVGGANPSPDLQTQVQTAAQAVVDNAPTAFDPSKKPSTVSDADFTKAKNQALGVAHNALAWVAVSKKDTKTAEAEYKASLQANPEQGNVSYQYGKMLQEDKSVPDDQKYPTVLFEYARAGEYTGPGQVPATAQAQIMDYFKKVYAQYHGGTDGEDQLLAQAKTSALPPDGFTIGSAAKAANQQADAMNQRIASDPAFKIWYAVKQSLTGDQGQQFFDSNVKDAEIPGGAEGVKNFTGTVISIDPPDRPTKVVLGVEDPAKPDATLEFSQPLPASALDKIKVGQKLDFGGVADSYTKDPYMLTFKDPTVPGVQTTAPAKKGRHR